MTNDFPADAIVAAAKRNRCDLIFISSHGRRGFKATLLGSQTQKVLAAVQGAGGGSPPAWHARTGSPASWVFRGHPRPGFSIRPGAGVGGYQGDPSLAGAGALGEMTAEPTLLRCTNPGTRIVAFEKIDAGQWRSRRDCGLCSSKMVFTQVTARAVPWTRV